MEEIPTGGLGIPKTVWGEEDESERECRDAERCEEIPACVAEDRDSPGGYIQIIRAPAEGHDQILGPSRPEFGRGTRDPDFESLFQQFFRERSLTEQFQRALSGGHDTCASDS